MKVIDVYAQYFAARLEYDGVLRRGALAKLTATSDAGSISYEVSVTFFPHRDEEDFAVSYDACFTKELYAAPGRRSKKREQQLMEGFRAEIDALAKLGGGEVFWDQPLGEARLG